MAQLWLYRRRLAYVRSPLHLSGAPSIVKLVKSSLAKVTLSHTSHPPVTLPQQPRSSRLGQHKKPPCSLLSLQLRQPCRPCPPCCPVGKSRDRGVSHRTFVCPSTWLADVSSSKGIQGIHGHAAMESTYSGYPRSSRTADRTHSRRRRAARIRIRMGMHLSTHFHNPGASQSWDGNYAST